MSKVADLKLSRTMLINSGNYSNCSSTVEILLKDVPVGRLVLTQITASSVLDSMLAYENSHLIEECVTATKNPKKYCELLKENEQTIIEQGKISIKKLSKILEYPEK